MLDRTPQPRAPLDILAQQIVAACVAGDVGRGRALRRASRAPGPIASSRASDFDAVVALHTHGRRALLHRDGVERRVCARRGARASRRSPRGGAIPDIADYQVVLEPEGTFVGTLNEDFAIESNARRHLPARQRVVADPARRAGRRARGRRARARRRPSRSGSARRPRARASSRREIGGVRESAATRAARRSTRETGHRRRARARRSPSTSRRASASSARCRRRARHPRALLRRERRHAARPARAVRRAHQPRLGPRAAQALLPRLRLRAAGGGQRGGDRALARPAAQLPARGGVRLPAPRHGARACSIQALLAAPMFETRWRWNVARALLLERMRGGKRVPAPLAAHARGRPARRRASPRSSPAARRCPPGDIEVPMDHPIVRQTIEDCLHEAMDVDGFLEVLRGLRDGAIERVAVDTPEPSAFARGILAAQPYTFLDDAPLEERRTQAVLRAADARRQERPTSSARSIPRRSRACAKKRGRSPTSAEEVHEALLWMGYVDGRARRGRGATWLDELARAGPRASREGDRWFAVEATRDPKDDPARPARGARARSIDATTPLLCSSSRARASCCAARFEGRPAGATGASSRASTATRSTGCARRSSRSRAAEFLRFLACWQHVDDEHRLEGPRGVAEVDPRSSRASRSPAAAWEAQRPSGARARLPARVARRAHAVGRGRLGPAVGRGRRAPCARRPICLVPREDLEPWLGARGAPERRRALGDARARISRRRSRRAARCSPQELARAAQLLAGAARDGPRRAGRARPA